MTIDRESSLLEIGRQAGYGPVDSIPWYCNLLLRHIRVRQHLPQLSSSQRPHFRSRLYYAYPVQIVQAQSLTAVERLINGVKTEFSQLCRVGDISLTADHEPDGGTLPRNEGPRLSPSLVSLINKLGGYL